MKAFEGVFADLLTGFVAFKQSLSFKYAIEADELQRFSMFITKYDLTEPKLTKELVQAWCKRRPNESLKNNQRRTSTVRQFALHLNVLGYEAFVMPFEPHTREYNFTPYIFTHSEIERIFESSDKLYPSRRSTMHFVLPVILRMLYSCGLRISEAVALKNKHVNLQEGILEIKNSKFEKDRLIPMSDSMCEMCRHYYRALHTAATMDDYFFMNKDGTPITRDHVYRRFREVLWESGISHGGIGKGPRVHDLRHTFAVHTLQNTVSRQIDPYRSLPILSTYLGHASVKATEQYLRLTAEVFPEIRNTLDKTCGYVIPEVPSE